MSAIAALRSATWASHQRLEKRLDVKTRFTELNAYRAHLGRMWGFCAGLERGIGADTFGDALPDYQSRRKLPLLTQDLHALGIEAPLLPNLKRCESVPPPVNPAGAFGRVYVLEGATLGGRSLLPLVSARLGLDARNGAAFLASYGDEVDCRWREFGIALDAWCSSAERCEQAVLGAVMTFDALADWLCEGSP